MQIINNNHNFYHNTLSLDLCSDQNIDDIDEIILNYPGGFKRFSKVADVDVWQVGDVITWSPSSDSESMQGVIMSMDLDSGYASCLCTDGIVHTVLLSNCCYMNRHISDLSILLKDVLEDLNS